MVGWVPIGLSAQPLCSSVRLWSMRGGGHFLRVVALAPMAQAYPTEWWLVPNTPWQAQLTTGRSYAWPARTRAFVTLYSFYVVHRSIPFARMRSSADIFTRQHSSELEFQEHFSPAAHLETSSLGIRLASSLAAIRTPQKRIARECIT